MRRLVVLEHGHRACEERARATCLRRRDVRRRVRREVIDALHMCRGFEVGRIERSEVFGHPTACIVGVRRELHRVEHELEDPIPKVSDVSELYLPATRWLREPLGAAKT